MNQKDLSKHLETLKETWSRVQLDDENEWIPAIQEFMDSIYEIGLIIHSIPDFKVDEHLVDFTKILSKDLFHVFQHFTFYYDKTTDELDTSWRTPDGELVRNSWEWVCQRWSSGFFLRELLEEDALTGVRWFKEDDDYEDELRFHARLDGTLADYEIPKGIPKSHWWWWLPDELNEE